MRELLLILGMTVVTFATRYPPLALIGRMPLPRRVFRALQFVPVAVLTAIIAPGLLMPQGSIQIDPDNTYLIAGLVAIAIAAWTRSLLPTIIGGMAAFMIWRTIF